MALSLKNCSKPQFLAQNSPHCSIARVLKHSNNIPKIATADNRMSEYSKRIVAFSAIAIALGISISLGIVTLPPTLNMAQSTTQTTSVESVTMTSTSSVATSNTTSLVTSHTTSASRNTTTSVVYTTTGVTTVSSGTTVVSSVTSVITSTVSSTIATSSSTVTSGSSSASYGSFSITEVSLSTGNNSSTLDITLQAIGSVYIGSATISVNNTIIGTPPASMSQPPGNIMLDIQPNQSSTIVLVIPDSTIPIYHGMTCYVLVYAWLGTPGGPTDTGQVRPASVSAT